MTLFAVVPEPHVADAAVNAAVNTVRLEVAGLTDLIAALETTALRVEFARACAIIADVKGRVIVTGMGKSGHVGRKIAATFASTGTPAMYMHPAEASHGAWAWSRRTTCCSRSAGRARPASCPT